MAKKVADPEQDTQGNLTNPLDDELGHPVLSGHPADSEEEGEAGPKLGEEEETPEEKAAREALEAETPEQKAAREALENKPEEFKPKYKTHEEAERAHTEAERRMHEATSDTAKEKARADAAEAKAQELELKLAEKEKGATSEADLETKEAELRTATIAARQKAFDTINELDRTDPDYQKKVAAAWGDADVEIRRAERRIFPPGTEDIDSKIAAGIKAEREKDAATKAADDKKTAQQKAWETAVEAGKKAGLALDDPEAPDLDLFEKAGEKLPEELRGKGATKEVCDWMIGYVRKRISRVALTKEQKEELARQEQLNNQPLGKGGRRETTKTQKGSTRTLDDDLADAKAQRTLR